jgi:hypothetical protein
LIKPLVDGIVARGRLPIDLLTLSGLRCVEVHADHLVSEFFGGWANRYGHLPRPGQALQVLLPHEAYCDCHANAVRRLDLPGPLPAAPKYQPNRAERRRRNHRGSAAEQRDAIRHLTAPRHRSAVVSCGGAKRAAPPGGGCRLLRLTRNITPSCQAVIEGLAVSSTIGLGHRGGSGARTTRPLP